MEAVMTYFKVLYQVWLQRLRNTNLWSEEPVSGPRHAPSPFQICGRSDKC